MCQAGPTRSGNATRSWRSRAATEIVSEPPAPTEVSCDRQRLLGDDYMRQNPDTHVKCRQHSELTEHEAPVPPQQMVSVPEPEPSAQIRFVLSVQQCTLVVQSDPAVRGWHCGHRRCRLRFLASVSPERAASPTTATVDATAAPTADLRVVRRVLTSSTRRVSESNRDPSTATSDLGDASASPVSTQHRPSGRQLPTRRKEARSGGVGRARDPREVVAVDDPDTHVYTAPAKSDASAPLAAGTNALARRVIGAGATPR